MYPRTAGHLTIGRALLGRGRRRADPIDGSWSKAFRSTAAISCSTARVLARAPSRRENPTRA